MQPDVGADGVRRIGPVDDEVGAVQFLGVVGGQFGRLLQQETPLAGVQRPAPVAQQPAHRQVQRRRLAWCYRVFSFPPRTRLPSFVGFYSGPFSQYLVFVAGHNPFT